MKMFNHDEQGLYDTFLIEPMRKKRIDEYIENMHNGKVSQIMEDIIKKTKPTKTELVYIGLCIGAKLAQAKAMEMMMSELFLKGHEGMPTYGQRPTLRV